MYAIRSYYAAGAPARTIHRLLEWNPATARFQRDAAMRAGFEQLEALVRIAEFHPPPSAGTEVLRA